MSAGRHERRRASVDSSANLSQALAEIPSGAGFVASFSSHSSKCTIMILTVNTLRYQFDMIPDETDHLSQFFTAAMGILRGQQQRQSAQALTSYLFGLK
jgi:hypothetical protein